MKNHEFSLKELIIPFLRKWKLILASALVIGLLSSGYSFFSNRTSMDENVAVYQDQAARYEQVLKSMKSEILLNRKEAYNQQMYNQESLLMKVNPESKQVAALTFSIEVEPDAFYLDLSNQKTLGFLDLKESLLERIATRYLFFADSPGLYATIDVSFPENRKDEYLREIIDVTVEKGVITIAAIDSEQLDAGILVREIYDYLLQKQPLIASTIESHSLTIMEESVTSSIDNALAEQQVTNLKKVTDALDRVEVLIKEIKTLSKEKPTLPSLKHIVGKSGIFGFVFGGVLGMMFIAVSVLFRFPAQFPEQIQKQIGIRFLGGTIHKRRDPLILAADRLAGHYSMAMEPDAFALISANLQEILPGHHHILVIGTIQENLIRQFCKKLEDVINIEGIILMPGADLSTSAETIRKLKDADAVLMVERLHVSTLKEVLQEQERVKLSGKPLLGYVLV